MRKLIRDKIAARVAMDSVTQVSPREIPNLLIDKVVEEAREVGAALFQERFTGGQPLAASGYRALVEELADVTEALSALVTSLEIDPRDVERARKAKFEEKGGFEEGWIMAKPFAPRLDTPDYQVMLAEFGNDALAARTVNALWRENVRDLPTLAEMSPSDILDIRMLGKGSLDRINEVLERHGLGLTGTDQQEVSNLSLIHI